MSEQPLVLDPTRQSATAFATKIKVEKIVNDLAEIKPLNTNI